MKGTRSPIAKQRAPPTISPQEISDQQKIESLGKEIAYLRAQVRIRDQELDECRSANDAQLARQAEIHDTQLAEKDRKIARLEVQNTYLNHEVLELQRWKRGPNSAAARGRKAAAAQGPQATARPPPPSEATPTPPQGDSLPALSRGERRPYESRINPGFERKTVKPLIPKSMGANGRAFTDTPFR